MRKVLLVTYLIVGFHNGYAQTTLISIPDITDYRTSRLTILDSLKTYLSIEEPYLLHFQFSYPNGRYTITDNLVETVSPYDTPVLMRNMYYVRPDYLEAYKKYNRGKESKGAIIGASLFNTFSTWYQSKNSSGFR